MTLEPFGEADDDDDDDDALLNELMAGALYDIINAVMTKCPGWPFARQTKMMEMIVEAIALRWGIVDHAKLVELVDREALQ